MLEVSAHLPLVKTIVSVGLPFKCFIGYINTGECSTPIFSSSKMWRATWPLFIQRPVLLGFLLSYFNPLSPRLELFGDFTSTGGTKKALGTLCIRRGVWPQKPCQGTQCSLRTQWVLSNHPTHANMGHGTLNDDNAGNEIYNAVVQPMQAWKTDVKRWWSELKNINKDILVFTCSSQPYLLWTTSKEFMTPPSPPHTPPHLTIKPTKNCKSCQKKKWMCQVFRIEKCGTYFPKPHWMGWSPVFSELLYSLIWRVCWAARGQPRSRKDPLKNQNRDRINLERMTEIIFHFWERTFFINFERDFKLFYRLISCINTEISTGIA